MSKAVHPPPPVVPLNPGPDAPTSGFCVFLCWDSGLQVTLWKTELGFQCSRPAGADCEIEPLLGLSPIPILSLSPSWFL